MNDGLANRLQSLRKSIASVRAYRDAVRAQADSHEREVESLRYRADLNQRSSEVIKKWLEDLLESNISSMADLATSGLRFIIRDQVLTFRIKQELKYNRLSMRFVIEEDGVESDPMSSFGGGAVLVVSLILRLAVMARLKMGNLLLLDESMSALANKYVPSAADFMRQLSEETGVNIFMVTHNDEFLSNAHTAYEAYVVRGKDGLKSLRLRAREYGRGP